MAVKLGRGATMLPWNARRARQQRAAEFLKRFPEDQLAVFGMLAAAEFLFGPRNAREAAEMTVGRKLSDDEWIEFGTRWEWIWSHITPL
jgi:hypothetical protein